MEKEREFKVVVMEDEQGNEIYLKVIKEMEHEGKKYVILNDECFCGDEDCCCGDGCDCHDEEDEDDKDEDEDFDDEDESDEEDEDEDFDDEDEDEEDEDDDFDDEDEEEFEESDEDEYTGGIYVFEVKTNEEGKEEYREIDYETMEELLPIVEKELYPRNE